jgi:glycerate 2-kinase
MNQRQDAINIFKAAVDAVHPMYLMREYLWSDSTGLQIAGQNIAWEAVDKLVVIAVGKAAAAMAQQAEQQLAGRITAGICITKYEHGLPLQKIELLEAAHPVPDENSLLAGKKVVQLIDGLSSTDLVLVLISGGASALLSDVPEGIVLNELQTTVKLLLNSGASIHEMNVVRKHLSCIKGGQLAKRAQPARVFSLIISDVVGDDLDVIASGPTVPDSSTFADLWQVLEKYDLTNSIPTSIRGYLEKGLNQLLPDTPKSSEDFFSNTFTQVIGSNQLALRAAQQMALSLGYHALVYKQNVTDDTAQLARELVQYALQYKGLLPTCFLLGGETTLKVTGEGMGGRNQHFVLCALEELSANDGNDLRNRITILSGGTDGSDGPTNATGAVGDVEMINKAEFSIKKYLNDFDAYHFFEQTDGLIITGATQTNVMDVMMVLIGDRLKS